MWSFRSKEHISVTAGTTKGELLPEIFMFNARNEKNTMKVNACKNMDAINDKHC